ncbi:hypothetical protein Psta_3984 [Pirellula staleyi DSM 6068]|uniref:Uncharacterized protein n=1 Tax=Pirellula staleyi (strain ATCC 27377 / DSM 6068 / ICPB 4128) TaxID=530564 RepID=D2R227_PIRSD|nr:hypothetical protein [Pirellula staleyi]ADB18638.1 hypothetical protein Psta_3984 [Pirellula staleyi DSM 6068]
MTSRRNVLKLLSLGSLAAITSTAPGCGFMAQMMYLVQGDKVDAKFSGLENKRVAVVCLDANSLGGPGSEADALARQIGVTLGYNVPGIDLVRQAEVEDWIDNHNGDVTDYREIGRGVKADMVLGIDLGSFSIHEGQTLLKGRANVSTRVYDMKQGGKVVFESPRQEIRFPENGARHVTEGDANFRTIFLHTLSQRIAKDFYAYDRIEDYGLDAAFIGD